MFDEKPLFRKVLGEVTIVTARGKASWNLWAWPRRLCFRLLACTLCLQWKDWQSQKVVLFPYTQFWICGQWKVKSWGWIHSGGYECDEDKPRWGYKGFFPTFQKLHFHGRWSYFIGARWRAAPSFRSEHLKISTPLLCLMSALQYEKFSNFWKLLTMTKFWCNYI